MMRVTRIADRSLLFSSKFSSSSPPPPYSCAGHGFLLPPKLPNPTSPFSSSPPHSPPPPPPVNPPDPENPDPATLREQWKYAIGLYSKWYSHAWGTAILSGLSFFALGWFVKGGNPLLDRSSQEDDGVQESPNSSSSSSSSERR